MSFQITSTEYVVLNGVPMHTPAWEILNLAELWQGPPSRGSDDVIPGAGGVRPNPRRANTRLVSLEICVTGTRDWEGQPYGDARVGLEENLNYLRAYVTDPTNVGTGLITCVLHMPSGATRQGDVHVETFEFQGDGPTAVQGHIDLSIPAGSLSAVLS